MMLQHDYFANQPPIKQLFLFLLLLLGGAICGSVLTAMLLLPGSINPAFSLQNPTMLRLVQFISATCTFLLPALAFGWFCSRQLSRFLSIKRVNAPSAYIWVLICMLLLSPAINLTGLLNKSMQLPEWMSPVEQWMRQSEASAEQLTKLLLTKNSPFTLISNLVVIAVTAAITEEFFFRGAMQRLAERWTRNPHTVIWGVAFLFSAFHLQFYGFLPRLLLGAYFGYLLLWSKSIWIPVFAHFVNNAFAVLCLSSDELSQQKWLTGEIQTSDIPYYIVAAAICLLLFVVCTKRLKILFAQHEIFP